MQANAREGRHARAALTEAGLKEVGQLAVPVRHMLVAVSCVSHMPFLVTGGCVGSALLTQRSDNIAEAR
jgi:hypothetical protein